MIQVEGNLLSPARAEDVVDTEAFAALAAHDLGRLTFSLSDIPEPAVPIFTHMNQVATRCGIVPRLGAKRTQTVQPHAPGVIGLNTAWHIDKIHTLLVSDVAPTEILDGTEDSVLEILGISKAACDKVDPTRLIDDIIAKINQTSDDTLKRDFGFSIGAVLPHELALVGPNLLHRKPVNKQKESYVRTHASVSG